MPTSRPPAMQGNVDAAAAAAAAVAVAVDRSWYNISKTKLSRWNADLYGARSKPWIVADVLISFRYHYAYFVPCSADNSDETDCVLSAHARRADRTTEHSLQVPVLAIISTFCLSLAARSDNRALAECNIPNFVLRPVPIFGVCSLYMLLP